MPTHQGGTDAEILQYVQQPERDGTDGGLCEPGVAQGLVLASTVVLAKARRGIDPVAQPAVAGARGVVPETKRGLHPGKPAGQVAEHSHRLRALAGK